jgi:hypothetical protein
LVLDLFLKVALTITFKRPWVYNSKWFLATNLKEWGLIQAIGLRTFPAGKFTPFFFLNKLTTINKEMKK